MRLGLVAILIAGIAAIETGRGGIEAPDQTERYEAEFRLKGNAPGEDVAEAAGPGMERRQLLEFIGDSITAGACILGRSGCPEQDSDPRLTYAFRLAERLGIPYRIRAVPGERIEGMVRQFAAQPAPGSTPLAEIPALVLINIGANDRTMDEKEYRAGMSDLLREVLAAYPGTRVVLLNFHRMIPNRWPVLTTLAQAHSDGSVVCFDARPYLVGYSDGGVHPDVESHRLLADALHDWIVQNNFLPTGIQPRAAPAETIP